MSDIRTVVLKHSTVSNKMPTPSDLEVGEVAINLKDKKIFTKDDLGSVQRLGVTPDEVLLLGHGIVFAGYVTVGSDTTHLISVPDTNNTPELYRDRLLSDYDLMGAHITVKVLDIDPSSPTHESWIEADGIVTKGFLDQVTPKFVIHNHYETSLQFYVRIDVPRKV